MKLSLKLGHDYRDKISVICPLVNVSIMQTDILCFVINKTFSCYWHILIITSVSLLDVTQAAVSFRAVRMHGIKIC